MPTQSIPEILVICGPTGTGKTAAAVSVAQIVDAEIVSADSMQVYRFMNIGTAKPTPEEQAAVRHHLIDVVYPDEPFDVRRYVELADQSIGSITYQNKSVLVVGGTGLYIRALRHGLFTLKPETRDVREQIARRVRERGIAAVYEELKSRDPESAARIHPNDAYRIRRALEVYESTGTPMSVFHRRHQLEGPRYSMRMIGLFRKRELLYERIDKRVDSMIRGGFIEEVDFLLKRGYSSSLSSMKSLGYRHIADYVEGRSGLHEAIERMKQDTRRYAKRQMTWFRAEPGIMWVDAADGDKAMEAATDYLNQTGQGRGSLP